MHASALSFTLLLERYVFSVATPVIDLIDRQSQDRLIQLLVSIDTSSAPVTIAAEPTPNALLSFLSTIVVPPEKTNERRLNYRKGPHNEKRRRLLATLSAGHQLTIDSTLGYISRVDTLLARLEKVVTTRLRKATLTEQYQSLRKGYLRLLIRTRSLQENEQTKLNRYH